MQVRTDPALPVVVFATHPQPRGESVCTRLRALRFAAQPLPAFTLEPVDPERLAAASARADAFDWLVFVSPTAVDCFATARGAAGWPARPRIAVMGAGSAAALFERGFERDRSMLVPTGGQDAQALLAEPVLQSLHGCRVLLVRGVAGRDDLGAMLRARGAQLEEVRAYRRSPADWPAESVAALDRAVADEARAVFVFTMGDAVAATRETLQRRSAAHWPWAQRQPSIAIHPRIAQRVRDQGWSDVRIAGAGVDALVTALESV